MTDTRTLKHAFNNVSEWYPENLAFVQAADGNSVSYRTANERARRVANALADLGVGTGDRVAIISETTVEHAIAYFGVQKLGAVTATVHTREAPAKMRDLVESVRPDVVLFDPEFTEPLKPLTTDGLGGPPFVAFDEWGDVPDYAQALSPLVKEAGDHEPEVNLAPDDTAFINFTSGTTGPPKGIVHTHAEAIEGAHAMQYAYNTREYDAILNQFGPEFIAWYNPILAAINVGAKTVFVRDWEPAAIPRVIEEEAVSICLLLPTQWKMVLQSSVEEYDLSSLRLAGYGGEVMSIELARRIEDQVTEDLFTTLGSTEILTGGTILHPHRITEETLTSIGRPVPGTEMRVSEPDLKDPSATVDRGEIGELIVRGPTVAEAVWDDPELTAETFHEDGWWFSGDLAKIADDGNIYLKGRTDNMIISGGINIYPAAVEGVIETHLAVAECAVIGVPHETWNETPKAFIRPSGDVTVEELDRWCKENDELGDYQRPREWAILDELPRTNTGKLDRDSLRAREGLE